MAVLFLVGACGPATTPGAGGSEERLLVAAASDLRPAFEVLGERFAADTGTAVTFDFSSSGQLAQRAIEGAPFDVFASADVAFVERVLAEGVGDAATRSTYAFGRLVIWSGRERWAGWASLGDLAEDGQVASIAIANPDHAPYGRAAQDALEASGAIDGVRDRLVLGENVSDAQRLVETGNADVGVIALSLALAADERDAGAWVLVDEELHRPLQQELLVTSTDPAMADRARAFVALVASEDGREVMRRYGFRLRGEEAAT